MADTSAFYTRVKGSGRTERFIDTRSGAEVSRRQRDKAIRAAKTGRLESQEKFVQFNRATELEKSLARPARGRKSARKLAPEIQADVVKARKELEEQRKEAAENERLQRALERNIERSKGKRVHVKKLTSRLLKAGRKAARIQFNDYKDYEKLYNEFKALGNKAIFYGIGIEGIGRENKHIGATLFRLRNYKIEENEFYEEAEDFIEQRPYFIFTNFWMHVAFSKWFYESKANGK